VAGRCECGNDPLGSTKMRGVSRLGEDLLTPQEGLCPMELVSCCLPFRVYYFLTLFP
jgi:hypothetical protein